MKSETAPVKHIARRTCAACHQVRAKRELVRLVRLADGRVEVDTTGKKAGRGTYLCRSWPCWQMGIKGKNLDHALRTTLTEKNRSELLEYGRDLVVDESD